VITFNFGVFGFARSGQHRRLILYNRRTKMHSPGAA